MTDQTNGGTRSPGFGGVFTIAAKNQWQALMAMLIAEYSARVSKRSLGVIEEIFGLGVMAGGMLLLRTISGARTHHGMPVAPFILSGIVLFWMLRTTLFRVSIFKSAKAAYRTNPRVTSLDVLFARGVLNVLFYICLAFPVFGLLYIFGISPPIAYPWEVLLVMCVMGLWAFSLGLCLGALVVYVPFARTVVQGLMLALMWISGILFIWPEAPYMFRDYLYYNPILHFMELMRTAYFSSYVTAMGSWVYVSAVTSITLACGLMLERIVRRRAESIMQRQGVGDDNMDGDGE